VSDLANMSGTRERLPELALEVGFGGSRISTTIPRSP
jgi:hypothetical protein